VNEIIAEIKNIQKNGIEESELNFIKNKLIKSLKRNMQTSDDWVDFHAVAEVFSPEIYNLETFVKNTTETTVEDIKQIIDKYFASDKWQLALCGRTKEESIKIIW
jgi:predicted Zn-dependent peptidase